MSANLERPHLWVIPEDDANRAIANGFLLGIEPPRRRQIDVRGYPNRKRGLGWGKAVEEFRESYAACMKPHSHVLLLIDFDGSPNRREHVMAMLAREVPAVVDRVYVLGVRTEPEDLKAARKKPLEQLGKDLAAECRDGVFDLWSDALLRHNNAELGRLQSAVRPILFPEPL